MHSRNNGYPLSQNQSLSSLLTRVDVDYQTTNPQQSQTDPSLVLMPPKHAFVWPLQTPMCFAGCVWASAIPDPGGPVGNTTWLVYLLSLCYLLFHLSPCVSSFSFLQLTQTETTMFESELFTAVCLLYLCAS